ncbi:MAG: zf-HC2 domain-containing protein [Candidatus Eiseniibacteriota bacterium]
MSDQWNERLSDYFDEALSPDERVLIEAHFTTCAECRTTLDELRAVVAHARSLTDRAPAEDLWPGIAARVAVLAQDPSIESRSADPGIVRTAGAGMLRGRAESSGSLAARRAGESRTARHADSAGSRWFGGGLTLSWPQLAAAGIALMLLSGSVAWFAGTRAGGGQVQVAGGTGTTGNTGISGTGSGNGTSTGSGPGITGSGPGTGLSGTGPDIAGTGSDNTGTGPGMTVRSASQGLDDPAYAAEVAKLERALSEKRNELDPETVKTIESNLRIIDLASAQAKKALDVDPANPYLKEHLTKTKQRKIEVLKAATVFASAQ